MQEKYFLITTEALAFLRRLIAIPKRLFRKGFEFSEELERAKRTKMTLSDLSLVCCCNEEGFLLHHQVVSCAAFVRENYFFSQTEILSLPLGCNTKVLNFLHTCVSCSCATFVCNGELIP